MNLLEAWKFVNMYREIHPSEHHMQQLLLFQTHLCNTNEEYAKRAFVKVKDMKQYMLDMCKLVFSKKDKQKVEIIAKEAFANLQSLVPTQEQLHALFVKLDAIPSKKHV